MKYELIIVRYAEIGLKAKYTRNLFESALINNIKSAFKTKNINVKIKKQRGRIYIYCKQIKKSITILQKIFGIISISPSIKITTNINKITEKAVEIAKNKISEKNSFALRVTREGIHRFTSQDIAITAGDAIVKATKVKVNLTKPDYELFIEIRGKDTYFYEEKIPAPGGLPVNTQGNVLAIIDNKESILSAWYLIRRGCSTVFIIYNPKMKKTLEEFNKNLFLNFNVIHKKNKNLEENNKIAHEQKCDAIVTGHTLYKNQKETLRDVINYKNNTNIPVLHPLIAMRKDEINKKLKEIGIKK